MSRVPRVRMFAGPNGSGKSRLNSYVNEKWLGVYVNADEIEKQLRNKGVVLSGFKVELDDATFLEGFEVTCSKRKLSLPSITCLNGVVKVRHSEINSYYAAMIAELIRFYLLQKKISFTFETVMSHESKLAFLKLAQEKGYRTYLYFIATKDPAINVSRVAERVKLGGHDVPTEKIIQRYHRAIKLLPKSFKLSWPWFVFDNSGDKEEWIVETNHSKETKVTHLEFKSNKLPHWMEVVISAD